VAKKTQARPELNYVIVKCETQIQAQVILDEIIDNHPESTIWPRLAYDDGFGKFIQVP
jgi:hypothetical protein